MKIYWLFMLVFSCIGNSILIASQEKLGRRSSCCNLDNMLYRIGKNLGRNDYLYLAHVNAAWYMKKKIEHKEHLQDVDSYSLRALHQIDGTCYGAYKTPLHEAIQSGSLDCVKLLCAHGADVLKKIEDYKTIDKAKLHKEEHAGIDHIVWVYNKASRFYVKPFNEEHHVGLNAIQLAEKLHTTQREFDLVPQARRKEICEFLISFNEKDLDDTKISVKID